MGRVWLMLGFVAFAILPSGCSTAQTVRDDSQQGPQVCEVYEPVWCIIAGQITIKHEVFPGEPYGSVWTVHNDLWDGEVFHVLEPLGCRSGLSDTDTLVDYDPAYAWHGKTWNNVVVRLKKDGSCDLNLLSPAFHGKIPQQGAFHGKLGMIRACDDQFCHGQRIGENVLPALRRQVSASQNQRGQGH